MSTGAVPRDTGLFGRDPRGDGPIKFFLLGWALVPLSILTVLSPESVRGRTSYYFFVGMAWGAVVTAGWALVGGLFVWQFGLRGLLFMVLLATVCGVWWVLREGSDPE